MSHARTISLDLGCEEVPGNVLLAPIVEEAKVRIIAVLVLPAS